MQSLYQLRDTYASLFCRWQATFAPAGVLSSLGYPSLSKMIGRGKNKQLWQAKKNKKNKNKKSKRFLEIERMHVTSRPPSWCTVQKNSNYFVLLLGTPTWLYWRLSFQSHSIKCMLLHTKAMTLKVEASTKTDKTNKQKMLMQQFENGFF